MVVEPVLQWSEYGSNSSMAQIHCEVHEKSQQISHLDFLRNVTKLLLQLNDRFVSIPGPKAIIPIEMRITDEHYLISTTQGRCVQCKKNTMKKCYSCDKRLHQDCYTLFHKITMYNK